MEEEEEFDGIYAFYFDLMIYMGCWVIETRDSVKKFLYTLYTAAVIGLVLFIGYMGVLDLIASVPDMDKIFYNTSFSLFLVSTFGKYWTVHRRSKEVDVIRRGLSRSPKTCKDPEEVGIYGSAVADLKFITRLFQSLMACFYPVWLVLSLASDLIGERRLPLPAKWPWGADIGDLKVFLSLCLFQAVFALFFLLAVISLEISLFGLLIQVCREYRFLIKKIQEFGVLCEESYAGAEVRVRETNIFLKEAKAKKMLGEIIVRQKELLHFTEGVEYCYSSSMFVHLFVGAALLIANGIQTMIVSSNFTVSMAYQYGYVIAIVCDMLYLFFLINKVSTECREVGTAFYSTPWYLMDVNIRRDIGFVILRTQRPPRITSGKFFELKLATFTGLMKNIYSWLALFRQIAQK